MCLHVKCIFMLTQQPCNIFHRWAMRMQAQWSSWWTNMESTTSSRSTPAYRWNIRLPKRSLSEWKTIQLPLHDAQEINSQKCGGFYCKIYSLFELFSKMLTWHMLRIKWIANQNTSQIFVCMYIIHSFLWFCMSGGYYIYHYILSRCFLIKETT